MRKQVMLALVGFVLAALLAGCMGLGSSSPPASLKVEPAGTLDFGENEDEVHMVIHNGGKRTLEWSITVDGGDGWLAVTPTSGKTSGKHPQPVTLSADRSGLAPGSKHAVELTIKSNGGNTTRTVSLSVAGEPGTPPVPPLGKVQELTVTGFTVPKGLMAQGPSSFSAGSFDAVALLDMARELDEALGRFGTRWDGGRGATFASIRPEALPAGYEAFFVVSWRPVIGADGYELFAATDNGDWKSAGTVFAEELEYDAFGTAVHVVEGGFRVGDERTFKVRAFNTQGSGEVSEADTGVIIGHAALVSPANGSTTPTEPRFEWHKHSEATGYGLYVAEGNRFNHVWHVVFADGETTVARYPEDVLGVAPSLAAGDYLWYITAIGPVVNGKTGGMAISDDWAFHVVSDTD